MARLTTILLTVAILIGAGAARADGRPDARRALVEAAWDAHTEGAHARAITLAEQAIALRTSAALYRFVAEEHLALGQATDAYSHATACVDLAESEPVTPTRDEILDACRALVRDLRARVGILRIAVTRPARTDVRVLIEGDPRDGDAFAVTPGTVHLTASAPGFRSFTSTLEVAPGATIDVRVALDPYPRELPVVLREAPPAESRSAVPPVLIGAGILTLAGGLALHFTADARYDDLRDTCAQSGGCPDGSAEAASIKRLDRFALGSVIVGGSLAVAGVTLFVLERRAHDGGARVDVGPASLRLRATF